MLEPPLGEWSEDFPSSARALKQAPFEAAWKKRPGIVRHGFTHFELEIEVYVTSLSKRRASPGMTMWVSADALHTVALPTVMRKIIEHGLDEGGPLFSRKP
jgi:A/G-specific adenine glycosylase